MIRNIRTLNIATVSNLYSVVFRLCKGSVKSTLYLIRFIKDLSIAVIVYGGHAHHSQKPDELTDQHVY